MSVKKEIPTGIVGLVAVALGILGRLFMYLNNAMGLVQGHDLLLTVGGVAVVLLIVGAVVSAIGVSQKSARAAGATGIVLAVIFLLPMLLDMAD